jgi:hypothetical protein
MPGRLLVCVVLALSATALAPATAAAAKAAVCGTRDVDGNPILGSLELNDNSSTIRSYGTGTGERDMSVLFDVTGCTLPRQATLPASQVSILPGKTGDDLPTDSRVSIGVEKPDATSLAATVTLKLDEIGPGTHDGILRIHMPRYLHDSFTPISESRTSGWGWPLVLGLLGSAAGLMWAFGLHFAENVRVSFTRRQTALLLLLAVGAGAAAGFGYWHNQDVWTLGENGWPTLISGFTASTAGALAGVTTALMSPSDGGEPPAGAEAAPPPRAA